MTKKTKFSEQDRTLYNPEILKRSEEYFQKTEGKGRGFPSLAGWGSYIGVNIKEIYDWMINGNEKDRLLISGIIGSLQTFQESFILTRAANGKNNSSTTKLLLNEMRNPLKITGRKLELPEIKIHIPIERW